MPFVRLTQPVVAIRFATIPAGAASGWVIGATAIGSFVGSVVGGWLADKVGFNAINWMAVIAAAGWARIVLFFIVWPADRRSMLERIGMFLRLTMKTITIVCLLACGTLVAACVLVMVAGLHISATIPSSGPPGAGAGPV